MGALISPAAVAVPVEGVPRVASAAVGVAAAEVVAVGVLVLPGSSCSSYRYPAARVARAAPVGPAGTAAREAMVRTAETAGPGAAPSRSSPAVASPLQALSWPEAAAAPPEPLETPVGQAPGGGGPVSAPTGGGGPACLFFFCAGPGGDGGPGGSGGTGGAGGDGGGGAGGAGGTVKLVGSVIDLAGATVDATGGAGAATALEGGAGRFIVGSSLLLV